jgi:hypothetical protein
MPSTSSREEIQVTLCFKKKVLARLVMDFKESSTPNFAKYIECIAENRYADLITADRGNVDRHPKPQPVVKPKHDARGRPQLSVKEREEIKAAVIAGKIRNDSAAALLCAEEEEP